MDNNKNVYLRKALSFKMYFLVNTLKYSTQQPCEMSCSCFIDEKTEDQRVCLTATEWQI